MSDFSRNPQDKPKGIFASKARITAAVVAVFVVVGGAAFGIASAFGGSTNADLTTPQSPPSTTPGLVGRAVTGTVVSVDATDSKFVLRQAASAQAQTFAVSVTSSTSYLLRGMTAGSFSDLKAGLQVVVSGTRTGTTIAASRVIIGAGGRAGRIGGPGGTGRPVAFGSVGSVNISSSSFTVTATSGTVTVDVASTTTFTEPGATAPTLKSLTAGERVAVFGTTKASTISATSVLVLPKNGFGGGRFGGGGRGAGGAGGFGGSGTSPGTSSGGLG